MPAILGAVSVIALFVFVIAASVMWIGPKSGTRRLKAGACKSQT